MRRAICLEYVSLTCVLVVLVCSGEAHIEVKHVTEPYGLSEGPHWNHRTQKLYFVDIYNQYIRRLDTATGVVTSAYIEHGPVGVVVPVDDSYDKLVAGSGTDLILVTWDGTSNEEKTPFEVLSSIESDNDTRVNDGKVDSSGRFWIGTMGNEVNGQVTPDLGSLYRINDTFEPVKEISPVSISNGLAWNIEDNTFYYIDSPTHKIAAYDYDPTNGTISNKRIVFDLDKHHTLKGIPDGMTIDENGNLWIALFGGHHVIEVNPKRQQLLRKIKIPAENITSVAFGGPLLNILYVTTSGYGLTAQQRKQTPNAGAVFAVKGLGVRGTLANSFIMNARQSDKEKTDV